MRGRVCDRKVSRVTITRSEGKLFKLDLVQVGSYHVRERWDIGGRERRLDDGDCDDEVLGERNCRIVLEIDCNS